MEVVWLFHTRFLKYWRVLFQKYPSEKFNLLGRGVFLALFPYVCYMYKNFGYPMIAIMNKCLHFQNLRTKRTDSPPTHTDTIQTKENEKEHSRMQGI